MRVLKERMVCTIRRDVLRKKGKKKAKRMFSVNLFREKSVESEGKGKEEKKKSAHEDFNWDWLPAQPRTR